MKIKFANRMIIEYLRNYLCAIIKQTNKRSHAKSSEQLPRFGKIELLPYYGKPYNITLGRVY